MQSSLSAVPGQGGKTLPGKEIEFLFQCPVEDTHEEQSADMALRFREVRIPLFVDMAVGIGGDTWPAAELFCDFLTSSVLFPQFQELFARKTVLELGSGNGLVGILIDKVFQASRVVVTDMDSHVPLIAHNILKNGVDCTQGGHCSAEAIDWMQFTNPLCQESDRGETFDVILALECVYREELFEPLILTLLAKSHEQSCILLGMTRSFVSTKFFELLRRYQLHFCKIPLQVLQNSGLRNSRKHDESQVGMFLIQRSPFRGSSFQEVSH